MTNLNLIYFLEQKRIIVGIHQALSFVHILINAHSIELRTHKATYAKKVRIIHGFRVKMQGKHIMQRRKKSKTLGGRGGTSQVIVIIFFNQIPCNRVS